MVVKLVSTDGTELSFQGIGLVPEGRLVPLEKVAAAAKVLAASHQTMTDHTYELGTVEKDFKALRHWLSELEKVWVIPQG
jgi:hypothetical protein